MRGPFIMHVHLHFVAFVSRVGIEESNNALGLLVFDELTLTPFYSCVVKIDLSRKRKIFIFDST